jgi:molybdate transport system permease protein
LGFRIVFTWKAAAIAAAIIAFPLLVRAFEQAFAQVPRRLEQLGETMSLGPWPIFFHITLPLSRRGLAYGCLLCFTRALGEFGATSLLAGNIPGETETLALGIYSRILNGEDAEAFALMFVSLALAFFAMWAAERYLRAPFREDRA